MTVISTAQGGISFAPSSAVEARLDAMAGQLAEITEELRQQRAQRELVAELLGELSHVAGPAMDMVTERMAALEAAGWFEFASHGAGVLGKVVDAFDGDDLDALGDNVVTILETVRSMTQPDVMALLGRATTDLRQSVDDETELRSLPRMLGDLRDPEVKRGFERLLVLLRSMGADAPHD